MNQIPIDYQESFVKVYKWLVALGVVNSSEIERSDLEIMGVTRYEPRKVIWRSFMVISMRTHSGGDYRCEFKRVYVC